MKQIITIAGTMMVVGLLLIFAPTVALMQAEIACEQDVTVQANDSLSRLAGQFYGDVLAFPAIIEATNAKAATDSSYAQIDNASVIAVGSKLCLPSAADAQTLLEKSGVSATAAVVDPSVDRVGFPEGYQEEFTIFYEFDRPDNKTARVIYANEAAASVQPGQPFPYGSILVMDVYRTKKDEAGNVLLDENGRFVRDELSAHFIMRKEPGFGAKYGEVRSGEWEYVAYKPDGTYQAAPDKTTPCAVCHVETGFGKDWVFGAHRFFGNQPPAAGENEVNVADYLFQQPALTVKVGTEVKWVGNDVVFHTVTANDMSFTGVLRPHGSFSHKFEQPGVFEYFCGIHPAMKGRIEVVN